jgi:voltage-gated potassium channel
MQVLWRFLARCVRQPNMALRAAVLLSGVLAYGTTGFLYFEKPGSPELTWTDALWYCLVTMTTVGYGDIFPKTLAGRYLVGVPLLLLGIGLLGFLLSVLATALVTARNREIQGMNTTRAEHHIVVVHYPGTAKLLRLLDELASDTAIGPHARIVLVDPDLEELPAPLVARGVHYVRGDPTRDATLQRANIDAAQHALVLLRAGAGSAADALNVAVTLAIEARAGHVNTVVECQDPGTEELLRKAGSDRVVCCGRLDALTLTQELLNPGVQDIVADLLSTGQGQQLYLTPVLTAAGHTVGQLRAAAAAAGHVLLGVDTDGGHRLNPPDTLALRDGDRAITLGSERLRTLAPAR